MTLKPSDLTRYQRTWINDARNLIDFLESRPELIPLYGGLTLYPDVNGREGLAEKLRVLGAATKFANENFIGSRRAFGKHEIVVSEYRRVVCERVQVGTETVEEELPGDADIPEGATVVGAVMRQVVRRTVPVFETRCPDSLLAGAS